MQDLVEFWSLTLTVPTLLIAAWVVGVYWRQAFKALADWVLRGIHPAVSCLLIMGIAIGFAGDIADNSYWGIAWGAEFFSLSGRDWLFDKGVWANVPFRQSVGIVAGTLHIWRQISETRKGRVAYAMIWVATFAWGIALLAAKGTV